jgi:dTDP-4-dehydrorhamnose reductase
MKKIMILGARGFLGKELVRNFKEKYLVTQVSGMASREFLVKDNTTFQYQRHPLNEPSIKEIVLRTNPSIIVNCSGLIGDEICSQRPDEANWANSIFPKMLANASRMNKSLLIHFSTDAVFGNELIDRVETDLPKPSTIYGKTKFDGEKQVLDHSHKSLIIRTNFYGYSGNLQRGLFDFFRSHLLNDCPVNGFADTIFNPILISEISKALIRVSELNLEGVLHLTGNTSLSKYRFGQLIAKSINKDPALIKKCFIREYSSKDTRQVMYLNSERIGKLGLQFMGIEEGIETANLLAQRGFYG